MSFCSPTSSSPRCSGVRRPTVSETARRLRDDGLIRYSRGTMRILGRSGLEAITCHCYTVVRTEFGARDRRQQLSSGRPPVDPEPVEVGATVPIRCLRGGQRLAWHARPVLHTHRIVPAGATPGGMLGCWA